MHLANLQYNDDFPSQADQTSLGNANANANVKHIARGTANENIAVSAVTKRNNDRRPLGSGVKRKRKINLAVIATADEITIALTNENEEAFNTNNCMKKSCHIELINEIKAKDNISPNIPLLEVTICRQTLNKVLNSDGFVGHCSPLTPIEPPSVRIIIQMARITQCITHTQGLNLVNNIIKDITGQHDLMEFKAKYSSSAKNRGIVGGGYWQGFKNAFNCE